MLGWHSRRVREDVYGASYLYGDGLQQPCARFRILVAAIRAQWGNQVVALFERAWNSQTLPDCASFSEWLVALPNTMVTRVPPLQGSSSEPARPDINPQIDEQVR